ncbi:MAG: hypothetical protein FJ171_05375 [Gammaproteobacteria bacterium]|nr:hypothetical protein [Gammaproteobacteria bacterium]
MKETLVAARWQDLATRLGIVKPLVAFRWLESRYQERARRYHTPHHINECIGILDRAKHGDAANPLVEFALWFHDAIYSTLSNKNEERSAEAAT